MLLYYKNQKIIGTNDDVIERFDCIYTRDTSGIIKEVK